MYQFLIILQNGKQEIVNRDHPITFSEANNVISELGHNSKCKTITFLGNIEGF